MEIGRYISYKDKIVENCSKVIVGKDEIVTLITCCFICSGNVLLEDLPGTGKTMMLRAFSQSIGGAFNRVQFTPDLLPSDLTGINFYNQKTGEFEFRPGPLFSNVVLGDEINRATPRTQSSLLEAMEEHQVSVDGKTHQLPNPFIVMATQNPIESYGTFPLPDAQVDRFMMKLTPGYMTREQEIQVMSRPSTGEILNTLEAVVTPEETAYVKENYRNIVVSTAVATYIMDIVAATRSQSSFLSGVSTRGAIALYQASQVMAAFSGRDFVIPEDVKRVAMPILCHRIVSNGSSGSEGDEYLTKLIEKIPVPTERV